MEENPFEHIDVDWRESDDELLRQLFPWVVLWERHTQLFQSVNAPSIKWPWWKLAMQLSTPRLPHEIELRARQLKVYQSSYWRFVKCWIRYRIFKKLPGSWVPSQDDLDQE